VWIHGASQRTQCSDPAIQVHRSDRHTLILRVSKVVSFEAPFIFLLFGNQRAVLFDTGPSCSARRTPRLRRTPADHLRRGRPVCGRSGGAA
jgi:hydroxyacylglutathione hydrolase